MISSFFMNFKNLRLVLSSSSSLISFSLKKSATASLVTSSSVGPRPPLIITISLFLMHIFNAFEISLISSLTVSM